MRAHIAERAIAVRPRQSRRAVRKEDMTTGRRCEHARTFRRRFDERAIERELRQWSTEEA